MKMRFHLTFCLSIALTILPSLIAQDEPAPRDLEVKTLEIKPGEVVRIKAAEAKREGQGAELFIDDGVYYVNIYDDGKLSRTIELSADTQRLTTMVVDAEGTIWNVVDADKDGIPDVRTDSTMRKLQKFVEGRFRDVKPGEKLQPFSASREK